MTKKLIWKLTIGKQHFSFRIYYYHSSLRWKDKYSTPRCESNPIYHFSWLGIYITFTRGDHRQWEQWLWINKYHNGDIKKLNLHGVG